MIHIFTTSINSIWTKDCDALLPYVSKERQEKIARIKSDSGKVLSLYAELLTRKSLCETLYANDATKNSYNSISTLNNSLLINKTKLGKPFCVVNNSNAAKDIFFNYSHTNSKILLAISQDEVGVDVEAIKDYPEIVANKICHKEELNYINSTSEIISDIQASPKYKFFKIWTRKEAYTKFLGTGISFDLKKFNTLSDEEYANYKTWSDGSYIYSIYAKKIGDTSLKEVSPSEILDFFINL